MILVATNEQKHLRNDSMVWCLAWGYAKNSAALQPFNPKKLLYSDYAQLPEAREKELNAEYSSLEDLVKYASSLNGFCRGLPLFMVKQAPKTSASQLCSSLR